MLWPQGEQCAGQQCSTGSSYSFTDEVEGCAFTVKFFFRLVSARKHFPLLLHKQVSTASQGSASRLVSDPVSCLKQGTLAAVRFGAVVAALSLGDLSLGSPKPGRSSPGRELRWSVQPSVRPAAFSPRPGSYGGAFSFLFFFRAANEVQPSHEWERYHLRPAHSAVSSKGSGAGDKVEFFPWFAPCGCLSSAGNLPASPLSSGPFPLL